MNISPVSAVGYPAPEPRYETTAQRIDKAREWAAENAPPERPVPVYKRAQAEADKTAVADLMRPGDEVSKRLLDVRA